MTAGTGVRVVDLDGAWELRSGPTADRPGPADLPTVAATVPGCVHTDLLAANLIPDPYLDRNEELVDWVGRREWTYRRTFDWAPDGTDRQELVFEGLDTLATIRLNGSEVGRTANQHRTHRFDVGALLTEGSNELVVEFDCAWDFAEAERIRLGDRPNAYPTPFQFLRKSACNFGWDWGPQLVTAGIWRPVRLESWSTARLAQVRPQVTVSPQDVGLVLVHVDLDSLDAPDGLELTVTAGGAVVTVPVTGRALTADLALPHVDRWWPWDRGDQPLYDLDVVLTGPSGELDRYRRRIAFRTVELDTSADEIGSGFTFVVNGEPLFVRGANWIPDDCFPARLTRDRLATRIDQAIGANLSLLRIWGGGLYESDDFYDLCDERGVLVWQDFLFACAAYPEEEPLRSEIEGEVRDNVVRLMSHPSLVLWNGCNENIWGHEDWDWKEPLAGRTWGAGYYFDLLPRWVAELDPSRPYYPGSPFSGHRDVHPNADEHGLRHIWDVWNDVDYTVYGDYVPRFAAEFGYQAPPTATTLYRSIHDDPLTPDSPGMQLHQKAIDGNLKLRRGAQAHLPLPSDFGKWLTTMHVQQAEAIRFGIEHFRSHRGPCMGTVVWQLNDCWPVTSWAAVDGDGRPKLLWTALRDSCAPRLVTVQPRAAGLAAVLVNDTREPWSGTLVARRWSVAGEVLAESSDPVAVGPDSTSEIALPATLTAPESPERELLEVTVGDHRSVHWFVVGTHTQTSPDPVRVGEVRQVDAGVEVEFSSPVAVRHLVLATDGWADGRCPPVLLDLVPGQNRTVLLPGLRLDADVDRERIESSLTHLGLFGRG